MLYKDKNKNKTIDKMFEYLKDNFFDNELLLFHDFNDLNLNYNFETKKYLNENFIFQNINKIFLQNKISEIKNFEKKFNFLEFENFKQIFEHNFEKDLKKEVKNNLKNNLINEFSDFDNLFKKKNILKLSLKYSIDSINKIKFYNFFELNILENENFENQATEQLSTALKALDARSQDIIKARWLDETKATLQDLAAKYNISAERVRQLETNALKKLKSAVSF